MLLVHYSIKACSALCPAVGDCEPLADDPSVPFDKTDGIT